LIKHIPEYFLQRYQREFAAWAATLQTGEFNPRRLFVFREGGAAECSPDPEQGPQLLGAWLLCKISRAGVEIEPFSERDREAIAKHCARMQRAGIAADAELVEPARPGIPGLN
jgi:hypothetical protein